MRAIKNNEDFNKSQWFVRDPTHTSDEPTELSLESYDKARFIRCYRYNQLCPGKEITLPILRKFQGKFSLSTTGKTFYFSFTFCVHTSSQARTRYGSSGHVQNSNDLSPLDECHHLFPAGFGISETSRTPVGTPREFQRFLPRGWILKPLVYI